MLKSKDIPGVEDVIQTAIDFPLDRLKHFMSEELSAADLSPEDPTMPRDQAISVMIAIAQEMYGLGLLAGAKAGMKFSRLAAEAILKDREEGTTVQ